MGSFYRGHYTKKETSEILSQTLEIKLRKVSDNIVLVCIGTDRSTGDSLGPLVGEILMGENLPYDIFGNLKEPVHAKNLQDTLLVINRKYKNPYIIAVDACLGKHEDIGYISIENNPLSPGAAMNKGLPKVGNISILGIVNISEGNNFEALQFTRLYTVIPMANVIARSISRALLNTYKNTYTSEAAMDME